MAFIPVPACVSAVIRGTYFSNPMITVLHFAKTGGGTYSGADCLSLATFIASAWPLHVMPFFCESYTLNDVKVTDQSSESGPSVTVAPGTPQVGGYTTAGLPGQNALVMTHRTALRGRSFRGRTYFGALVEPLVVGNQVDGTHMINLLTGWGNFLDECEAEGHILVIASRYTNNAPRVTGVATPVTTSAWRNGNVDSQRRRSQVN